MHSVVKSMDLAQADLEAGTTLPSFLINVPIFRLEHRFLKYGHESKYCHLSPLFSGSVNSEDSVCMTVISRV
jgi:hypothetical protein